MRYSITVTEQELNQALAERARQFPGQERQLYQFFQQNPQAIQELRAPIFEDKVIDFIAELASITEKKVSIDDLMKDPDEATEAKPKKKAAPKKAAAKKSDDADADTKKAAPKKAAAKKPAAKKADDKK